MTSIQLTTPTADDLQRLCLNLDPGMRAEQEELAVEFDAVDLADRLLSRASAGLSHVFHDREGAPILAAGFNTVEPWVLQSWMVARPDWRDHHDAITQCFDAICSRILAESAVIRLQVLSMDGRRGVEKWLGRMGFTREGVLSSYGYNGAPFAMYARTARQEG